MIPHLAYPKRRYCHKQAPYMCLSPGDSKTSVPSALPVASHMLETMLLWTDSYIEYSRGGLSCFTVAASRASSYLCCCAGISLDSLLWAYTSRQTSVASRGGYSQMFRKKSTGASILVEYSSNRPLSTTACMASRRCLTPVRP